MSSMEINRVLEQIRSLQAQTKVGTAQQAGLAQQVGLAQQAGQTQQTTGPSAFANILRQGLDQVSQTEQHANQLTEAFQRGTPGVELPQVMLEVSKASVSLRAASEVRNRLISAYQDIMNMQL
jgi:flagellar hook-basal body complex protein FliE